MMKKTLQTEFRNQKEPLPPPGDMLIKGFLRPMNLSQSAFGRHIGAGAGAISSIVAGKRALTMDMSFRFAAALGTLPEMWLHIQMLHDLTKAYIEKRDLEVAGWITPLTLVGTE